MYLNIAAIKAFLGLSNAALTIVSGKDKLDSAFSVFEEAKSKANDALLDISRETEELEATVELQKKMHENAMSALNGKLGILCSEKGRGLAFIQKLNNILA